MTDRPDWGETLDRTDVWIDGAGRRLVIAAMDPGHCINVYRYLTQPHRAEGILHSVGHDLYGMRGPDEDSQAGRDFGRALEGLRPAGENPVAWIKEQPLLLALAVRAGLTEEKTPEPEGVFIDVVLRVRLQPGEQPRRVRKELDALLAGALREIVTTDVSP